MSMSMAASTTTSMAAPATTSVAALRTTSITTYLLAFESTHAAMAASRALASSGVDFANIPTPAAIHAGCGIALKFNAEDPEPVLACAVGANRSTGLVSLYCQTESGAYVLESKL